MGDKEAQAREIEHWIYDHFAHNVYSKRDRGLIRSAIRDFIYQQRYLKLPEGEPPLLKIDPHQVDSPSDWAMGAEAQRDADIEWMKGCVPPMTTAGAKE